MSLHLARSKGKANCRPRALSVNVWASSLQEHLKIDSM